MEKIGLNEKQALVYEACLELSSGSGQRIAEKAGLPKSTTYDVLKGLSKKGLVKFYLKGKKRYFSANDPDILKDRAIKQQKILENFLPDIQAIYNLAENKPKIRYYEGKQGVRVVMKEILKEAQELRSIGSAEDIFNKLSEYFPEFSQERAKRRIPNKVILRDSPKAKERQETGAKELREVKIIKTSILFSSLIWIWGSKTAMVTLRNDLMVVVIDSQELSDTFLALFEWMWQR